MTPTIVTALTGFSVYMGMVGSLATVTPDALMKTEMLAEAPTYPTYSVAMTGYNAVPEQTDGDPFTTASGAYSDTDIMAARSRDLADELPFGTVIAIDTSTSTPNCGIGLVAEQVGLRVVGDTMHSRMVNKVDILFDHEKTVKVGGKMINPARVLGSCKNIQIKVVGHVDIKKIPKNQTELRAAVGLANLALSK